MINDLATEATTVHSRFPHAIVAFIVIIPLPAIQAARSSSIIETLERLARRSGVGDSDYLSEAISLVCWEPENGTISTNIPNHTSPLRIENFTPQIEKTYYNRYKGLPPHSE